MTTGPNEGIFSGDYDAFSKKVDRMHSQISMRKMMTSTEKRNLEIMLNQIKLFAGINNQEKDHLKEKILYLLKTYYSLFND